jgi:hypothetical protein
MASYPVCRLVVTSFNFNFNLNFKQGVSLFDATPEQITLADADSELARFVKIRALEHSTANIFISRLFLVPKPGKNQ